MLTLDSRYGPIFHRLSGEPIFSLRENDYVVDGYKKVGGNAQSIIQARWLHHTSFLWDFDDADMKYLAMPQKRPNYRGDRPHTTFLTRLAPRFAAADRSFATASTRLADEVETELGRWFRVHRVGPKLASRAAHLPRHRRPNKRLPPYSSNLALIGLATLESLAQASYSS